MSAVVEARMLVAGKLRAPAAPAHLVARPRVEGLIAALVERYPAVFVTATAGAGKTTAVAQASPLIQRSLAWLTLGDGDVAAGRLLEYVAAAIGSHVPGAPELARSALAAGVPHDEVAGIVAESVGDQRVLLVLDQAERLASSPRSLAVVEALARYAPREMRVVVLSRRELPIDIEGLQLARRAARVDERDLAFTADEAGDALRTLGRGDVDPEATIAATGGWVAGVLFEGWRTSGSEAAAGGLADPLHGYLARNITDQLDPGERDLLLVTSVLTSVTADRALALGVSGAGARLAALRARHLPATWESDPLTLRCHPRFREYLLDRFEQEDAARVQHVWGDLGRLLERERYLEEAVEAFLKAGSLVEGAEVAEACIVSVAERLDFDLVRRWLDRFGTVRSPSIGFTAAALIVAVWTDDFAAGTAIGDGLAEEGRREELVRSSSLVAALLAYCYASLGRAGDARALLDLAQPGPLTEAVRYALTILDDAPVPQEPVVPALTGGPLDIAILRTHYHRGLLDLLAEEPPLAWDRAIAAWRVLAMQALGQTGRALDRYERSRSQSGPMWMAGVELMLDLGREQDARELLAAHRPRGPRFDALASRADILEAKLELRCGDARAARRVLARVLSDRMALSLPFLREHAQTWLGLALLLESEDERALSVLRQTVSTMVACGRRLLLPAAAVYLSEAEWRAGEEVAADRAADVALDAARFQGSYHIVLRALADYPAVAWRRVEAETVADSPWHRFARSLRAPRRVVVEHGRCEVVVEIVEFGNPLLRVESEAVRPRLTKAHTLLAFLAASPEQRVARRIALRDLFESGSEKSTAAYLRQAVRSAREALPPEIELELNENAVECMPLGSLDSESVRFERLLANAAALAGRERFERLTQALALPAAGDYLDHDTSPWAAARRRQLDDLAEEALADAADAAYELGDYAEAQRLAHACVQTNAYRESSWRLLMRIAGATRDEDAVLRVYRECRQALAEIGTSPSATTTGLLSQLRR